MKTIQLSAKMIASILNEDVDRITREMKAHFKMEVGPNIVYNCSDLKIMRKTMLHEEMIDVLAETIRQNDVFFHSLLRRIIGDKTCVQKINFVGQFAHYDRVLSNEKVETIINKLADLHEYQYSNKTPAYESYWANKNLKPVAV